MDENPESKSEQGALTQGADKNSDGTALDENTAVSRKLGGALALTGSGTAVVSISNTLDGGAATLLLTGGVLLLVAGVAILAMAVMAVLRSDDDL